MTSLADLSLSLDKLAAAMQHFISSSPLTNAICWPFVLSHLKTPAAPHDSSAPAAAADIKASDQQTAAESDSVLELTQQWINGVVNRATHIICTLHQV